MPALDDWTRLLALAALGCLSAQCSPRTLVLVDPRDAGTVNDAFDGLVDLDAPPSGLRRGLVGLWHFDDGAGSTTALDSSGSLNHGTLVGLDPSSAWTTEGRLANALETRGQGYASVPKTPSIEGIITEVSLAAWVYLDGVISDYATAASRQIGSTLTQYYHLALNQQARPSLFINTRVPSDMVVQPLGPVAVPPLTWIHLAGTFDGATARLYVDGILVDSAAITGTFAVDTTPFILGGNGNLQNVTERFPGRIDEIVLYDRALEPGEVSQLAAGGAF